MAPSLYVGTAAWSIPKSVRPMFDETGSVLEKYSRVFNSVEINSSFYREHETKTYTRWARTVPDHFRFAVKLSRSLTHETRLKKPELISDILPSVLELGEKLGVLLIQLAPSLVFESQVAQPFFYKLRTLYDGPIALEARHPSWTSPQSEALIHSSHLSPVRADPEVIHFKSKQRLLQEIVYFRMHGTPEIYKSSYDASVLTYLRDQMLSTPGNQVWCIFDNTTFGHATENALQLKSYLPVG